LAIAVITDPGKSKRHIQDGCIAAYHLILAAKAHGLGTCWIAAMDREDVKEELNIPADHYVATITPLGYPSEEPKVAKRRNAKEFVRFVE
jgi:nitroreductase